ncbi:MAG TPA: IPT/TIG domain-containing protein, partial [Pyrinomonadaceae bacterium]|nr:IPT/TIG domain-containing protein [Pyrinomonadaceae bacterium]
ITYDESVNTDLQHGGGHIATLVISPKTKLAHQSTAFYQHQSVLRMTAEGLGLAAFPGASATAPNMSEFFGTTPNTNPVVSNVSPASGPTAGGTIVSISGTGFASGATMSFGGMPATNVTVVGSTSINATTPAHASGSVNVVVTNPGGENGTKTNGYLYVAPIPPPVVNGVSPNSGSTAGGTSISISGSQFAISATVSIGGTAATNVTVVNSTSITATTPIHAAGTVAVTVTNPDGQSGTLNNAFTYNSPPAGETVLLTDDFNDGSLNTAKWVAHNLFSGFTDSTVAVVETQTLDIGPLKQGVSGSHYNGIRSGIGYDFTGGYAYVQIVQGPNSNTTADAFYTIGLNVDNCYRMYVEAGSLILQSKLGGTKRTLRTVAFNSTNHAFWRIRHDAASGNIVFETAPAVGDTPGVWTSIHSEAWNTSAVPLSAVSFELKAGTWTTEVNNPGTVKFDNFKAAKP